MSSCKHCKRCKNGCDFCDCCGKCQRCDNHRSTQPVTLPLTMPYPVPYPVPTPAPYPVYPQPFVPDFWWYADDRTYGSAGAATFTIGAGVTS